MKSNSEQREWNGAMGCKTFLSLMKTVCTIESKSFKILRDGNQVSIQEIGSNYVSIARMSIMVAGWVVKEMKRINSKTEEGFLSKMREGDLVAMISVRSNHSGKYISLFLISKSCNKGSICIPKAPRSNGWETFCKTLSRVIPNNTSLSRKEVSLEPVGGKDSLIIRKGFENIVESLSSLAVVFSFSNFSYSWKHLVGDLSCMFDFLKTPTVSLIGGNAYILKFSMTEDVDTIMATQELVIDGCSISFDRWRPSLGTMTAHRSSSRWIELIGIPVHLINKEVISEICVNFGKVKKIETLMGVPNRLNCVQVLLSDIDILKVPHYTSLVDQGVPYLLRVSLSINELYPHPVFTPNPGQGDSAPKPVMPTTKSAPIVIVQDATCLLTPPVDPVIIPPPTSFPPLSHVDPVINTPPASLLPLSHVDAGPSNPNPPVQPPRDLGILNQIPPSPPFQLITGGHPPENLAMIPTPLDSHPNLLATDIPPIQSRFNSSSTSSHVDARLSNSVPTPMTFANPSIFEPSVPTPGAKSFVNQPVLLSDPNTHAIVDNFNDSRNVPSRETGVLKEAEEITQYEGDDLVSDSGDESDHCREDIGEEEVAPQGEALVQFISEKLVIVNRVLDVYAASQSQRKDTSVENGEDKVVTTKKASETPTNKTTGKTVTISARRRKRGALLLQSEKMYPEPT